VKGATLRTAALHGDGAVSIHAPVKGATCASSASTSATVSFNPRAREGRDLHVVGVGPRLRKVSIHAPVKGATGVAVDVDAGLAFQSTRP